MILFAIAIFIDNVETRVAIIIVILCASLQIHNEEKPFLTENLNSTENNACISTFLIFIVKFFNFSMQGNLVSEYVCMALVVILEIQFLYKSFLNSMMIKIYSYIVKRQKKQKKVPSLIGRLSKRIL